MDQIGNTVIYIDASGRTHEALVFGQNVLHPDLLDLIYVDSGRPGNDNIVKVFAIEHHEAKKETNPDIPAYPLNAWKEYGEQHQVIPPDHPNFDHPFRQKELGMNGQPLPVERPLTDAFAKTYQELSKEDATELAALSGSGGMAVGQMITGNEVGGTIVTPVTTTEGLQAAIEGITDKTGGPAPETPGDPTVPPPQADGGDPPNCQPGQLC